MIKHKTIKTKICSCCKKEYELNDTNFNRYIKHNRHKPYCVNCDKDNKIVKRYGDKIYSIYAIEQKGIIIFIGKTKHKLLKTRVYNFCKNHNINKTEINYIVLSDHLDYETSKECYKKYVEQYNSDKLLNNQKYTTHIGAKPWLNKKRDIKTVYSMIQGLNKRIVQYDINGENCIIYPSMKYIAINVLKDNKNNNIKNSKIYNPKSIDRNILLNNHYYFTEEYLLKTYGFVPFKIDFEISEFSRNQKHKILEIDRNGNVINNFNDIKTISALYNIGYSAINDNINFNKNIIHRREKNTGSYFIKTDIYNNIKNTKVYHKIKDFKDYVISNDGELYSFNHNKILTPEIFGNRRSYKITNNNGNRVRVYSHLLLNKIL